MSAVPPPSRRVLPELGDPADRAHSGVHATAVARAWQALEAALDAHEVALAALDRLDAALVAAYGHPSVALPVRDGVPAYASEAATIERYFGRGDEARRLKARLRRRRRTYARASAESGLDAARLAEGRAAHIVQDAAATLLLAPAATLADLALKLRVLVASGEAGPPEAQVFPWAHLRTLLSDLRQLAQRSIIKPL